MDWITDPNALVGLLTLTALEIVLGIDNIIFISILSGQLPRAEQARARRLGLGGAFLTRILLLLSIAWIVRLTAPLFTLLGIMLWAATPISDFVDRHPTIRMLAMAFLVLIGTNLVAEGLGQHIPKGYTYFAMFFSFLVEMLNLRLRAKQA